MSEARAALIENSCCDDRKPGLESGGGGRSEGGTGKEIGGKERERVGGGGKVLLSREKTAGKGKHYRCRKTSTMGGYARFVGLT